MTYVKPYHFPSYSHLFSHLMKQSFLGDKTPLPLSAQTNKSITNYSFKCLITKNSFVSVQINYLCIWNLISLQANTWLFKSV